MLRTLFFLLALLWLPAGVCASVLIPGFGSHAQAELLPPLVIVSADDPREIAIGVATTWLPLVLVFPAGLPLALACRGLHRRGSRVTASVAMAMLGVATVVAGLVDGWEGPETIIIYALVISLPVWLTGVLLRRKGQ